MEDFFRSISPNTKEWSIAILVMIATVLSAQAVKSILSRLYEKRGWRFLKSLAPSFANLVYILGFGIFFECAPLRGRIERWAEGGFYIFAVAVLMRLFEKTSLIGIDWSLAQIESGNTLRQGFLPLIRNLIRVFIFGTGGIMVLNHFHYDAMSLITALGVSSLAVGLAAKETLSNMISGFILMIDRNLKPGDTIQLAALNGKVLAIGLRSTQVLLGDGNTLIVPNSDLVNNKILNLSMPTPEKACSVQIRVPYSVPFSKVQTVALEILNQIESVSQNKTKSVQLLNLSEGYQLIQATFWVVHLDLVGSTTSRFNEQLLLKAQNNEIELLNHSLPRP